MILAYRASPNTIKSSLAKAEKKYHSDIEILVTTTTRKNSGAETKFYDVKRI